jgi:alpha/beta hydrolase family protein DUF900
MDDSCTPDSIEKMKNLLRPRLFCTRLVCICVLLLGTAFCETRCAHAQVQTNNDGSVDLPFVDPTNVPTVGTFWLLSTLNQGPENTFGPPLPFDPYGTNASVYFYGTNDFGSSFVIDDTTVDPSSLSSSGMSGAMMADGADSMSTESQDGGGSGNGPSPLDYQSCTNCLWLEITQITNGFVFVTVHGTVEDMTYELLSKITFTNDVTNVWASEGTVIGSAGQDWTATTVAIGTRTNDLFLWARSWMDSDGDGLPDWWELANGLDPNNPDTGDTGIPDGYKNPAGDGWNNIYKYEHGMSPNQFYTPPSPRNIAARVDPTGTNVILTWESGGGPVSSYGIESTVAFPAEVGTVSSGTHAFTDSPGSWTGLPLLRDAAYVIRAYFPNGSHADSPQVKPMRPALDLAMRIVPGPSNLFYLTVAAAPPDLDYVRFYDVSSGLYSGDVYASNFVKGVAAIPFWNAQADPVVQVFSTNGDFGAADFVPVYQPEEGYYFPTNSYADFFNTAVQLKENLKFLLRAASTTSAFSYFLYALEPGIGSLYFRPPSAADYDYSGYHRFVQDVNAAVLERLRPVEDNYIWRNFVFSVADGGFSTGAYLEDTLRVIDSPEYAYLGRGSETPLPLAITNSLCRWILAAGAARDYTDALSEAGLYVDGNTNNFVLAHGVSNVFGLPISSVHFLGYYGEGTLLPGDTTPIPPFTTYFFTEVPVPALSIVDYYFASQTPWIDQYDLGNTNASPPPLPGSPTFSVTNPSPPIIVGIGQPITVSGWAKMAITNGAPGKYGYLEQYFDKAYQVDTDGAVTTNQTGVLSPYGVFFPTEAGPAALVTMPDIDTGQRGTGIVSVIKLQLDVNHDGIMDLTFAGPDNASVSNAFASSPGKPFVFWANNDYDAAGLYADADRDVWAPQLADYDYSDPIYGNGKPCIHSKRDLEDYARLWICGVPALTNGNYQVSLSWENVNSGNPKIHLFQSVETNGGTLYLTDTNIAAAQTAVQTYVGPSYIPGPGVSVGTVAPGAPFVFPSGYFSNYSTKYLLFEGAGIGRGELKLTVSQGSNVLAQTSALMDIHDVRDLYEEAYATNVTSGKPPSSLISNFGVLPMTKSPTPEEAKQVIVFIHGINNTVTDYETTTRTIFKRLYWAGYHGRLASFRWPCAYLPPTTANPFQYNLGEFYSFKSATGLKNYLSYLRNNRPDLTGYSIDLYAHSQGTVIASEAVLQGAPFDNCVLSQGAFPAHCYDTNAPFLQKLLDAEIASPTPLYTTNGGYHGYCLPIQGNLIDFYNTNDFALATGTTLGLQTNWEEDQRAQKPEDFFGGPSYGYSPSTGITTAYSFGNSVTVSDLQEIKAMVARSRSKAVGAQNGLRGSISASIDLFGSFGFANTRSEHSGQFARPIQTCLPYYRQMLTSFQILTP